MCFPWFAITAGMSLEERRRTGYNKGAVGGQNAHGRALQTGSAMEMIRGRRCGSGDPHHLPRLHALGTDPHAPLLVIHQELSSLQVRQPPALRARSSELPGATMTMPDIMPVLGALFADMASLS